jgi:hypothetical protein
MKPARYTPEQAAAVLKAKQEELTPYLTFTLIRDTLGFDGNSSAQNIIAELVARGLLEEYDFAGKKGYRVP